MKKNLTCFYCQNLKNQLSVGKKDTCAFCGAENNPLYLVAYRHNPTFFCCSCAWWSFPRSEKERANKWYQERKNKTK